MKIRSVINLAKEIFYLRSLITRYGDSLARGRYWLFDNFRSLALDEQRADAVAFWGNGGSSENRKRIIKWLNLSGCFCNHKKNTTAEYEAIYSANNYDKVREIKLFSFKKKKILTVCTSETEAKAQLKLYNELSLAFCMPKVVKSGKYPGALEVSMVDKRPFPGDSDALNAILRSVENFQISTGSLKRETVKNLIAYSYEDAEIQTILRSIVDSISPAVLHCQIPLCVQHGDLSKDNLIYGEAEGKIDFWWIDWEHMGERPFFYDYFFYIVNSAVYFDTKALDYYMSEAADVALVQSFSHFGFDFSPKNKKDYLLIFMIVFLKERVCAYGRIEAMRMYQNFIKNFLENKDEI